VGENLCATDSR